MLQMSKEKRLHNGRQGGEANIPGLDEGSSKESNALDVAATAVIPALLPCQRKAPGVDCLNLEVALNWTWRWRWSEGTGAAGVEAPCVCDLSATEEAPAQELDMCNTRKLDAIALCLLRSSLSTKPSKKTKQTPWNDSQRQTIPKLQQKRFLKKLAGEKLRNRKLGAKKKVAREFNNSSDRRIDRTPGRRRQAVLMRWEREREGTKVIPETFCARNVEAATCWSSLAPVPVSCQL